MSGDPGPAPVSVVQGASRSPGPIALIGEANPVDSVSDLILEGDIFSGIAKTPDPWAKDVSACIGLGVGGIEGDGICSDNKVAIAGKDCPGWKAEGDSLADAPVREVDVECGWIVELDPFRHWILWLRVVTFVVEYFVDQRVCRALQAEGKRGK